MKWFRKSVPENPASPIYTTCQELTSIAIAEPSLDPDIAKTRRVTWVESPNRFLLTELIVETENSSGKPTTMHELARTSAERADLQKHEYDRYYIVRKGIHAVLHNLVVDLKDSVETERKEFVSSTRFVIDNELYAPNAQDEVEAEWILHRAVLDGVEPN